MTWHSNLSEKLPWYRSWHDEPGHPHVHWTVFILFSLFFTGSLLSRIDEIYKINVVEAATERQLLGGWRLRADFARGAIAIDFSRNKLWLVAHAQRNDIFEYDLPPMGTGDGGTNFSNWPALDPVRVIPGWWPTLNC